MEKIGIVRFTILFTASFAFFISGMKQLFDFNNPNSSVGIAIVFVILGIAGFCKLNRIVKRDYRYAFKQEEN